MAQSQIMTGAGLRQSDSAATANAFSERDNNGDCSYRDLTATRALRSSGSLFTGNTNKTASFNADATARNYTCNTSAGTIVATLPAAASCAGQELTFIKTHASNTLTIDGNAAELVGGAATLGATAIRAAITVWCDGTEWHVRSKVDTWS